ncbi:MAG TPA: branched-chain amino acid ABC transporter permease [Anaerolineales bacterium]|nr:branched-chain amino acid ABC transporter permease [Anaerolineales bacterium]
MRNRLQNISLLDIVFWFMRVSIIVFVVWGTISTLSDNPYTARNWIDFLVLGIAQGSMYALIAIGYTLVYGVLFMINFAHGEFFMSGIMTATVFIAAPLDASGYLDKNPVLSLFLILAVAMLTSVGVALLTERIAYRPLRKAPRLVPLITAIGASFFLQHTFRGLYGSEVKPFPEIDILSGKIPFLGTEILRSQMIVIIVTIILLIGLYLFIMYSKTGKAIRAVAEDKDVAALMGIDVDRTIAITFALGASMAGAAGVLYALVFRQVHFFMGFLPGLKAFTAAVLGGIGSIPGAALGGLFIGIFESVGPPLFLDGLNVPAYHQLKDVITFSLLVLVLIFRPQGILGERLGEKKA